MTLANPLGLAAFQDLFRVEQVKFVPMWNQERSLAGGGDTQYADRAPALWTADITTRSLLWSDAHKVMALINSRAGGLKTVLLHNPRACYPASDPGGSIFGAATPLVGTIADRLHVAFTGFPNSYVMPAGAFFQVIFDSSRYYLGQFAEARTADGSGAIASVEIAPALPASVTTGDAVTVIKPAAKFRLTPNSAAPAQAAAANRARISFSAEQTYSA